MWGRGGVRAWIPSQQAAADGPGQCADFGRDLWSPSKTARVREHTCTHVCTCTHTQPLPPHEAPGSESTSPALLTVLTWETGFPPDA